MLPSKFRQTLRRLWASKGFCSSVILTLSLAIGATVSVFSIINAVLIQPLPYPDSSRLVTVYQSYTRDPSVQNDFSPAGYLDYRQRNHSLVDLAAYCGFKYNLTGRGEPKSLQGSAVSASIFPILGVKPLLGRTFFPEEDDFAAPHVAVLSYHLWSTEFQNDPQVIGKAISLNGGPFYVVGVMPPKFTATNDDEADIWVPLQQQIRPDRMLWRDQDFLRVIGRLRPGVTMDQARADLSRVAAQLHAEHPATDNHTSAVVISLQQALVGDDRKSLLLSLGIVVLVLLIASSNVAILMLARVSGRTREFAVRIALGASARQIVMEVLGESVILGLLSGVAGILLAYAGRALFLYLSPGDKTFDLIQINPAVLAFTVAISTGVGLGFGLLPALKVLRADVQHVLRSAGNAATIDRSSRFLRHALIVGEISISLFLLISTGLLLRSMINLERQPLGFQPDRVLTSYVPLPRIRYQNDSDEERFFTAVDERLRTSPAIAAVGMGYPLPLQGNYFTTSFTIDGKNYAPGERETASVRFVDSRFFDVLRIPILEGRGVADADDVNAQPVVVVSESFARKYWPGEDAVGRYITVVRNPAVPRRIVGIVGDVRGAIEDEPLPTLYIPYKQMPFQSIQIALIPRNGEQSAMAAIREAIRAEDIDQPVYPVQSMNEIVYYALEPWRFALSLLGALAGLAVILVAIGLFAVISYLVRERTKELGLRMAIGASRSNVMQLVLSQSLKLALIGIAVGLVFTVVLVRLMTSMVYAIRPKDPLTFAIVAVGVAVIAIVAACIPALRAAHIEPLSALREE